MTTTEPFSPELRDAVVELVEVTSRLVTKLEAAEHRRMVDAVAWERRTWSTRRGRFVRRMRRLVRKSA